MRNIFLIFLNSLALSFFVASEATIDDRINCIRYSCDFENGNLCSYASENPDIEKDQKRALKKWQIFRGYERRSFHGTKHFGKSSSYASVFLSKDESAVLATRDRGGSIWKLKEDRIIKFKYYETSPGIRLKGCCDDLQHCPFLPERKFGPLKPGWKMASFECKAGARKVLFHAHNSGISKAGVRVDDIRIFYPPNYPEKHKANKDVCAVARAENRFKKMTTKSKVIFKLPSRRWTVPRTVSFRPPPTRPPHSTSPTEPSPPSERPRTIPTTEVAETTFENEESTAPFSDIDLEDPIKKLIYVITFEDEDNALAPSENGSEILETGSEGLEAFENVTLPYEMATAEPTTVVFNVTDNDDAFSVVVFQNQEPELIRRDEPSEILRVLDSQQVPSGQGDDLNCAAVVCNFEQGTMCNYQNFQSNDVQLTRGSWQQFQVYNSKYRNAATGIRQPGEGLGFASAYLKPGDKAALASEGQLKSDGIRFVYPLTADKVIRFKYYKVADLLELKGCCDNLANCPFSSGTVAKNTDFARWKTGNFLCKAGTLRYIFYATNDGPNEGAVGLDDIQLFTPSGGTPESAQQNACDNSGKTNSLGGGGPAVVPIQIINPGPVVYPAPGPAGPASYLAPSSAGVGAPTVAGNSPVDVRGFGWGPNPNNTLNSNPVATNVQSSISNVGGSQKPNQGASGG